MTKMDMILYGFVFAVVLVGVVGIIREIKK
jgi:tetrahydromethanopterin S-methyltransferase subunit F